MVGQALGAGAGSYDARPHAHPPTASGQRTRGSEEDLPAQYQETGQEPRISAPHVHACRTGHHPGTPSQGPPPSLRVTVEPGVGRIHDRATFEALRRSGCRARRGPVTVTFAASGGPGAPKVAYAVGRRVGGAVVRNRLRRRLRSVVRGVEGLAPGAYLVGVAPEAVALSYEDLKVQVTTAMTAVGRKAHR
jgi:ribonuclease P protein component